MTPSIRFFAALLGLASVVPVNSSVARKRSDPAYTDPNNDPFYHAPANISAYKSGQIVRSRPISSDITYPGAKTYQLLYQTLDWENRPTATIATIWIPPTLNDSSRVLSYQFAEDSDNLDCAPSWAWVSGSGSDAQASERLLGGPVLVPWALERGYLVVSSDAEGPNSTWLVGVNEGRATLDGIRAIINHQGLNATDTPVALYGYSGGAHTTVWAGSLAATYAPELNIAGAAYGGTPVDLRAVFELDNDTPSSTAVGAAIFGLGNGYSHLNATLNSLLTPEGRRIASHFRAPRNCSMLVHSGNNSATFNYTSIFTGGKIIDNPALNAVFQRESLLMQNSNAGVSVPKFPRLVYHGTADTLVPYWPEAQYVSQQCSFGADIRFVPFAGHNHGPTLLASLPGAFLFLDQLLNGTLGPAPVCGSPAAKMPALNSSEAETIFGPTVMKTIANVLSLFE